MVYEGRGWGIVGAHAKEHNLYSVGIAFMGNFNGENTTTSIITFIFILYLLSVYTIVIFSGFVNGKRNQHA